jgi:hypothetical protein
VMILQRVQTNGLVVVTTIEPDVDQGNYFLPR